MKPIMIETKSSNIKEIGYKTDTKQLFITFKTKMTYIYEGVESEAFDEFLAAESVGSFANKKIYGKFPYSVLLEKKEVDENGESENN